MPKANAARQRRISIWGWLALLIGSPTHPLWAQFSGLAATADGASVYFSSTLRLKTLGQPLNGKIYVATQDDVSLFRARDVSTLSHDAPACSTGGFADYLSAETSSSGTVALLYRAQVNAFCSYPPNPYRTQILGPWGEMDLSGVVRLSPDGQHAIIFNAATARPESSVAISFLDLKSGVQTPVKLGPEYPQSVLQPDGSRVIANDATALIVLKEGVTQTHGYIVKPGEDPKPFPVADALPLMIDATGSKVLYQKQGLNLIDLHTLASTLLIPGDTPVLVLRLSDDARRLFFLRDGQAHSLDTATLVDHTLTNDSAQIAQIAASSDGGILFAVTGIGRLLKINVDEGSQTELIGRTPYLNPFPGSVVRGLTTTLTGSGLSDTVINGTPPLNNWLGNVTMWIGERKVPMTQLTPASVSFIVPWDIQTDNGSIRMLAESPGDHTPFYFPETVATLFPEPFPRAGAILRQDWSQTYVGPIHTGEIIHVYAVGFGPVSPDVPEGAAAPSAEPFARITQSFQCSNADILYAGLAPGAVERVYQIDIRIGPTPGYQKFDCSLGGLNFPFLTLNIVP